jgi:hypothetical protein
MFVGTWRLLEYTFSYDDDTVEHPWGTDVAGYLLYSAEGYMSANLNPAHRSWRSRRARLAAEVPDVGKAGATHFGRGAIPRDYIGYSGGFALEGNTITHMVEVSLFPHWVGLPQLRYYAFEGDQLTLRTPPVKSGKRSMVAQLRWERVR